MSAEYPTDEELNIVREWPLKKGVDAWFAFIYSIWHWPDWGFRETPKQYHLSTGGWSGNESIISAMQSHHILWSMTWYSSRTGGHYIFRKLKIFKRGRPLCR